MSAANDLQIIELQRKLKVKNRTIKRLGRELQGFKRHLSENAPKSSDGSGFPKSGSSSPVTVREQMEAHPPPCYMCGRPPHPDYYGHSYRPESPSGIVEQPSVEPKGPKSADASSNPKTDLGEQKGQA